MQSVQALPRCVTCRVKPARVLFGGAPEGRLLRDKTPVIETDDDKPGIDTLRRDPGQPDLLQNRARRLGGDDEAVDRGIDTNLDVRMIKEVCNLSASVKSPEYKLIHYITL